METHSSTWNAVKNRHTFIGKSNLLFSDPAFLGIALSITGVTFLGRKLFSKGHVSPTWLRFVQQQSSQSAVLQSISVHRDYKAVRED